MRSFEFARQMKDKKPVLENENEIMAFPNTQLPEYQTTFSAGADFFCAEDVTIPSIWHQVAHILQTSTIPGLILNRAANRPDDEETNNQFKPTVVHTGVKASMESDEVLYLYNRSSNPKKLGLILANSVGVVDSDYYNNEDNDGEIMFAFYNLKPWDVTIHAGDRIGQGVFAKYLRPTKGLRVKSATRVGGIGSTGSN